MDLEDVIYLSLLFASIAFGLVYRKIEDGNIKKFVGTAVGVLIALIVSGPHILHSFITILINSFIILYMDKRKCHLASFIFSFTYLMFFRTTEYFGIPYPPGHTNLVQMMLTLKLVGLAFEVNSNCHKASELSLTEIFHYSFNYIGVLTGPYIRYKTFKDYFELPFARVADWKRNTLQKVKYIPLHAILFLLSSMTWPLSYAKSDEFYEERSVLYRFWYIWPNFFTFRMRLYIGLVLSECVCTVAGFGAYPEFSEPKSGHGPSKDLHKLDEMKTEKELQAVNYSFETIHNVNPYGAEFCPIFRESMKHWNMCIQYWLAVNVYKRFPMKAYRTFVTMFVSAVWHGVYTGYYVCLCGAPFVLPIEDVYVKLVLKGRTGTTLYVCQWFMVVFKMFFFSYLSIAFHMLSLDWVMHYYNSIYHLGLIISILLYGIGLALLRFRRLTPPPETHTNGVKAD